MTDHTGMDTDYMFGDTGQQPLFTTSRQPSTRLDRLASYVRIELRAISGDDVGKQQIAATALKGMF